MIRNSVYYIYCLWVWILTILYYLDIVKFSLLYSSVVAFIFTLLSIFLRLDNILDYLIVVTFELFIVLLNVKKHFFIDKKNVISYNDIILNIILFLIYNLFLMILGSNFYDYYFVVLKKLKYRIP